MRIETGVFVAGIILGAAGAPRLPTDGRPSAAPVRPAATTAPAEPADSTYWIGRQVVSYMVRSDTAAALPTVQLVRSWALAAAVDSVLRAVRAVGAAALEGVPVTRQIEGFVVAVALDRTASRAHPTARRLPRSVRRAFRNGALADWIAIEREVDGAFSLEDFAVAESRRMPRYTGGRLDLARPDSFGLLRWSPNRRWVMHTFAGIGVLPDGRLGYDVDIGWQVFDGRTGEQACHWLSTTDSFDFATWVNDAMFVIVGTTPIDQGFPGRINKHFAIRAPAIWCGDLEADTLMTYLGAPLDPRRETARQQRIRARWLQEYPRLRLD